MGSKNHSGVKDILEILADDQEREFPVDHNVTEKGQEGVEEVERKYTTLSKFNLDDKNEMGNEPMQNVKYHFWVTFGIGKAKGIAAKKGP